MGGEKITELNTPQSTSQTYLTEAPIDADSFSSAGINKSDFHISIDGVPWSDFINTGIWSNRKDIFTNAPVTRYTAIRSSRKAFDDYFNYNGGFPIYNTQLKKDIEISVDYVNSVKANSYRYTIDIYYKSAFGIPIRQEIFDNGGTNAYTFQPNDYLQLANTYFPDRYSGVIPNFNGKFILEKGNRLMGITVTQYFDQPYNNNCEEGFNFIFEGLQDQQTPTEFEYKVTRNEDYISAIGITSLSKEYPEHNTGSHIYSSDFNRVEFKDNSQYYVEPKIQELGGTSACGRTYSFNVIPKDEVEKYTINIQAKCTGQNGSILPTASVFFREQGKSEWEGTRFINGKSTLFLKPETLYEIEGEYEDAEFSFTLGTGEQQLQKAIEESIINNPELQDIVFTNTAKNGDRNLDIEIIFTSKSCPI